LLSVPFKIQQDAGESLDLGLSGLFTLNVSPDAFSLGSFGTLVSNDFLFRLRNSTTNEVLVEADGDGHFFFPSFPGRITLSFSLMDLDFGDTFVLEIFSQSMAHAVSTAEFVTDHVEYNFGLDQSFASVDFQMTALTAPAAAVSEPPSLTVAAFLFAGVSFGWATALARRSRT
jgi:hypothetical protein